MTSSGEYAGMTGQRHDDGVAGTMHWVVEVSFTDGDDQHFVFVTREQAEEAVGRILEAEPGTVVKLSDHVFVQRDHVTAAQVVAPDA